MATRVVNVMHAVGYFRLTTGKLLLRSCLRFLIKKHNKINNLALVDVHKTYS
jgi:hypothetical protein